MARDAYMEYILTKGSIMNRIDTFEGQKIIGYKKAIRQRGGSKYHVLIKLEIGARTRRVQPFNKKCRAATARVLEITTIASNNTWYLADEIGGRRVKFAFAYRRFKNKKERFRYDVGSIVKPVKKFDPNPREECKSGIHFFLTEHEAQNYHL